MLICDPYDDHGHFSRFIRPGARSILCGCTGTKLIATAFINTDGGVAVVLFNEQDEAVDYALKIGSQQAEGTIDPHAITTLLIGPAET